MQKDFDKWNETKKEGTVVKLTPSESRTYAFIDASNIHYGSKEAGFTVDYAKLRSYLTSRFSASRLFYFGAIDEMKEDDRAFKAELLSLGYELKLVRLKIFKDGKKKADTDSRMTFEMMKMFGEYDRAVVLSGDGDFYWVLEYLKDVKEKVWLLGMASRTARDLTKLFGPNFIHLGNVRKSIEKNETDATFASASGVNSSYSSQSEKSMGADRPVDNAEPPRKAP